MKTRLAEPVQLTTMVAQIHNSSAYFGVDELCRFPARPCHVPTGGYGMTVDTIESGGEPCRRGGGLRWENALVTPPASSSTMPSPF